MIDFFSTQPSGVTIDSFNNQLFPWYLERSYVMTTDLKKCFLKLVNRLTGEHEYFPVTEDEDRVPMPILDYLEARDSKALTNLHIALSFPVFG